MSTFFDFHNRNAWTWNFLFHLWLVVTVKAEDSTQNNNTCPHAISGRGTFYIPSNDNCEQYILRCNEEKKIYRIELESDFQLTSNTTEDSETKLRVDFNELNHQNESSSSVTLQSWLLPPEDDKPKLIYLLKDSVIEIHFDGEWTGPQLVFKYEEIDKDNDTRTSNDLKGEMRPWIPAGDKSYLPNHIYMFHIRKSPEMNDSSITITLKNLDIDEEVGEYLLIGAGLNLFEGPPPLFVSQSFSKSQKPKTYIVNDENAYVVFVSGPRRQIHAGFEIMWEQKGTRIAVEDKISDDDITEDILNSIPVCIFNLTAAEAEFYKTNHEWFHDFKSEFAALANEYANEENIQLHSNVTPHKVNFFRISAVLPVDENHEDLKDGALYTMLRIKSSDKGRAIFTRQQLLIIFHRYTECCVNTTKGYKISYCPLTNDFTRKFGKIILYCLVPISCCLLLLLWTWKKNPLLQYLNVTSLRGMYKKDQQPKENVYVCVPNGALTKPKMYLTTDQGRRVTLYDDDSDVELFNKDDFRKIREMSAALNYGSARSSMRSRSSMGGVANEAFENTDNEFNHQSQNTSVDEPKQENVYDSLKSRKHAPNIELADDAELTKF